MTELEEEKELKRLVASLGVKRDPRADDELGWRRVSNVGESSAQPISGTGCAVAGTDRTRVDLRVDSWEVVEVTG